LLAGFSATEFIRHDVLNGRISPAELAQTLLTATRFRLGNLGFSGLVSGTVGRRPARRRASATRR